MTDTNPKYRLTPRQQAFVDNYLITYSPKKAAIAAGYNTKHPSKVGYQALQSPAVQAAVKEEQDKRRVVFDSTPFEMVLLMLIETMNDESLKPNERMKAADLLIKYKAQNKWTGADANHIEKYVEALRSEVGEVWNDNK